MQTLKSTPVRIEPGFGPIFKDTRIHLQHMIPEMKKGYTDAELLLHFPTLKLDHIRQFREYYQNHTDEILEQDGHLTRRTEERVAEFKRKFPDTGETLEEKKERMTEALKARASMSA